MSLPPPVFPTISIIGGCQVSGLAATARALLPGATVTATHVGVDLASSAENVAASVAGSDLVLSQFDEVGAPPGLRASDLRARGLNVVVVPVFVFPGFHPDMIYLPLSSGGVLSCEGIDYHSRIAAAAFRLGLDTERTYRLYNSYVFSAFNYFDTYNTCCALVVDEFEKYGFDLKPLIPEWMSRAGAFMHTINHPKIIVLADLGTLALKKSGLVSQNASLGSLPTDNLEAGFVGAVFPSLANRIGVSGSDVSRRPTHRLLPGQAREITLRKYIASSFAKYYSLPRDLVWGSEIDAAAGVLSSLIVGPSTEPRSLLSLLESARAASAASDWLLAELRWSELKKLQPDSAEAYISLGEVIRELGDFPRCDAFCSEAWHRFPGEVWIGRNWALSAHYAGDIPEAIRRYYDVIRRHNHDVIAADLADCLMIVGDINAAEKILESAILSFPDSRWVIASRDRLDARRTNQ